MADRWDRHETDKWHVLGQMSVAESIKVGEALWMSDLARIARAPKAPRPISLAVALGLGCARAKRAK